MIWNLIWRALEEPVVYRAFSKLFGQRGIYQRLFQEHLPLSADLRILDLGCGPGNAIEFLPKNAIYVGVDSSTKNIQTARHLHPSGKMQFHCTNIENFSPAAGSFNVVLALGLLHHLNDAQAKRALTIAYDALVDGGLLLTTDTARTATQTRIARYFSNKDRGRFVRWDHEYVRLAAEHFPNISKTNIEGETRIPCSLTVLVCKKH